LLGLGRLFVHALEGLDDAVLALLLDEARDLVRRALGSLRQA
jgi:hypothetical protein